MENQIVIKPTTVSTTLKIALQENNLIALNEATEKLSVESICDSIANDRKVKHELQSVDAEGKSIKAYLKENPDQEENYQVILQELRDKRGELIKHQPIESLAVGRKINGEAHFKTIQLLIIQTVKSFNVGKSMTGEQAIQLSMDIQREYYNLTIEDLVVCFRNGRSGHYGKVYDRLDGAVFMDWLQIYHKERFDIMDNRRQSEHEQNKSWGDSSRDSGATVDTEYQKFKLQYGSTVQKTDKV